MNGFKQLKVVNGVIVNFKIYTDDIISPLDIILVLSCDEDIFGDTYEYRDGKYYRKLVLSRTEWARRESIDDISKIPGIFLEAVNEFNNIEDLNLKNPVNKYLLEKALSIVEGIG